MSKERREANKRFNKVMKEKVKSKSIQEKKIEDFVKYLFENDESTKTIMIAVIRNKSRHNKIKSYSPIKGGSFQRKDFIKAKPKEKKK